MRSYLYHGLWATQVVDDATGGYLPFVGGIDQELSQELIPEVFEAGERTWEHFTDNVASFVEDNGGTVANVRTQARRVDWGQLQSHYDPNGDWLDLSGPIPVLSAPSSVERGTEVTFAADQSYVVFGAVNRYEWEVEMANDTLKSGTGPEFSVTFPREGNYYLHLTVTGGASGQRSNTLNTTVNVQK